MSEIDKDFLNSGIQMLHEAINHFAQADHPESAKIITILEVVVRVASAIL